MKKYALLVGVEEYNDARSCGRVDYATRDALEMGRVLDGICNFDQVTVLAGEKGKVEGSVGIPTRLNIMNELADLARAIQDDDLFLFQFVGHGWQGKGKRGFSPCDFTLVSDWPSNHIEYDEALLFFSKIMARQQILIFDCCRTAPPSGGERSAAPSSPAGIPRSRDLIAKAKEIGKGDPVRAEVGLVSRAIINACAENEPAWPWHEKQHGLFTYYLIEGISQHAWENGRLPIWNLAEYVRQEVANLFQNSEARRSICGPGGVWPRPDFHMDGGPICLAEKPNNLTVRQSQPVLWNEQEPVSSEPGREPDEQKSPIFLTVGRRSSYRTIQSAIDTATDGATIRIEHGRYQEFLKITRPVNLLGADSDQTTLLEADGDSAILWDAPSGSIRNLTIRHKRGLDGSRYAVDIIAGSPVLEELDIRTVNNSSGYAVGVRNGASPIIRASLVHDADGGGISFSACNGTIEDSQIYGNGGHGICVSGDSHPLIRNNRIFMGKSTGICVIDCEGKIENNQIYENKLSGIDVGRNASPTIRRNKIFDGLSGGIFIHNNARGTIEDNDISTNAGSGVVISDGALPSVRINSIHHCKEAGIFVHEGGGGEIDGNDIFENFGYGIIIGPGGKPSIYRNKIHGGKVEGIVVFEDGQGLIEDNDIFDNAKEDLLLKVGAKADARSNRIKDRELARERERAERERAERERAEREQAEREQAEREQAEREQAEREQAEREQAEREQAEREQAEREQAEREQAEREQAEREQAEREQAEREQAEREQAEREQAEREQAEREQAERQGAAAALEREGVGTRLGGVRVLPRPNRHRGGFGWLFGSASDRYIKGLRYHVEQINELEPDLIQLSDDQLRARTAEFREKLASGTELDVLLVEAFATVREAAKRTLGQRHFDVQMMGGIVLHRGMIAEMANGEGKTLVSTLPVYLNALSGRGVHVVTVNDYLAKRDAEWMGQVYRFLGMSVGCIVHDLDDYQRQVAYRCDVTYGTNNELGFDYLRDNMKFRLEEMVQRPFNYAIADEVDSILIDEARTPLIISGPTEDNSELYIQVNRLIPGLTPEDYEKDEKQRTVTLTESGTERVEEMLQQAGMMQGGGLYDTHNVSLVHHVNQALRAHKLFSLDTDYIAKDDKIIIIDEFTGRMMEGRRYSEGLHQALEAKEGVTVQNENQTLASITVQNYFRMYPKLAGMTGTAMVEAEEFSDIYKLDVIEVPTNLPVARVDFDDEVYRTSREKFDAIVEQVTECQKRQQPVLVGTVSIEKSEALSELFKKKRITHNVLNARYHEQEAYIIAQAGRPGAVTIATNMAGRGTDIQLGGNLDMRLHFELAEIEDEGARDRYAAEIRQEVGAAREVVRRVGGLFVIGSERHESRRIDNQLRGRSGRQGDPGVSKFFVSLEDDLMRIFGSERMDTMLSRLGLKEDEAVIHPWVNKALAEAQRKVEARNYDIRKQLLEYDDALHHQRHVIYERRHEIMNSPGVAEQIRDMRKDAIATIISRTVPQKSLRKQWDAADLHAECVRLLALDLPIEEWAHEKGIDRDTIKERITAAADRLMAEKAADAGPELMRMAEKGLLLQLLDQTWKDHLLSLDALRQGIHLRAYSHQIPIHEYKREALRLFEEIQIKLSEEITAHLAHIEFRMEPPPPPPQPVFPDYPLAGGAEAMLGELEAVITDACPPAPGRPQRRGDGGVVNEERFPSRYAAAWAGTSRNADCPCGSGKKFKHCHGRV